MIKTVIFDLGNVLLHFSEQKQLYQLEKALNIEDKELKRHVFTPELKREYEKGKISTDQFCELLKTRAGSSVTQRTLLKALSNIFQVNTPLIPIVKELRNLEKRLLLLSNISEAHHQFIEKHFTIFEEFDAEILSYQVGAMKPDPEIFEVALNKAQCEPEECFYTDDIAPFVEAAKKFGIDGEQFTNTPSLLHHLHLRHLNIFDTTSSPTT